MFECTPVSISIKQDKLKTTFHIPFKKIEKNQVESYFYNIKVCYDIVITSHFVFIYICAGIC